MLTVGIKTKIDIWKIILFHYKTKALEMTNNELR